MSHATSPFRGSLLLLSLLAAVLVAATPSRSAAQQSLQLDGVNDYVTFGAAPSLGATTFTVEVAFKRTAAGVTASTGTGGVTAVPLLTKGRGEADGSNLDMNWFLGINATNQLVADYEEGAGQASPGLNHPVTGTTAITNNVWHHAAAVFDGTTWTLYLDGNVEATLVVGAGRLPRFDSIQHAGLGTALTSTGVAAGAFAGNLDEARVWNVARTQAQIQAGIGVEIPQATGLVGRWGLNEGSGTGAGNSVASGVNGTLTNGPIWSADSNVALATAAGLRLSGANAYVALGSPASLQLSAFTIEAWVRRDGAGIGTNTGAGGIPDAIPFVAKGRAEAEAAAVDINYLFGIRASDGVLCADFEEGAGGASPSLNHPVAGVTPITTGVWHHVAATYDGASWKLYLDGVVEASLAVGQPPASASGSPVAIGSALTSAGVASGFFDGLVDEVRIWSFARTQAQIVAGINSEIGGPSSGLVGRWGMSEDQGTVVASTAGTTLNGTLTGASWAWAAGAPFNASVPAAPADPSGLAAAAFSSSQIDLTWADNASNETGYEVERSTTGIGGPFTLRFTLPAGTVSTSDTGLSPVTEYCYRVRAVNGTGPSGYAAAACATTQAIPPPADPSGLTATAVTPVQVDLAWTDNAGDETGYEVERSTTGAGGPFTLLVALPANSVSYSNTALDAATEYCYRVRAVNGALASGYAAVACATTLPAPAAPTALAAAAVTSGQIHLTWTDNATDETGYAVERSTTGAGGPFTVAATLAANASAFDDLNRDAGASDCYRVRALGAYVPSAYSSVECASTPAATPGSLDLAGATYVAFGDPNALDLASFTLECWFRRDGAGTTTTTGTGGIAAAIPLVTHGAPEADNSNVDMNYFMGLRSDGVLCADFEEGAGGPSPGLNHPVTGTTPVAAGSGWHHAAATYDGTTWNLYLDGNLEATLAVGRPLRSNSIQRAALGTALTSTGATNGFFDGAIDEARVWSVARTQAEIRAAVNAQLSTPQTGLAARWSLDEGMGTIVNSSAGTEVPGAITGSNYSWSGPASFSLSFTPPDAPSGLSASTPTHAAVLLTWNDNSNDESSFQIERSTTGSGGPFAPLATVAPNTTSYPDGGLDPSAEYCYRVRAVNGNGPSAYDGPACATTLPNTFTITASAGPGGAIDPAGDVVVIDGANQTFTITPAVGYHIADVLVDGGSIGAIGTYTFSAVAAGHTIAATFALDTYTISAFAGPGGSIDPSGEVIVSRGFDRSFAISASTGYHVADVLVDGTSVGPVATYTFSGVTGDHSIAATFAINSYTLTATAGLHGSIAPAGATSRNYGEDQSYAITPDPGYHVLDLLVDGVSAGGITSYTFSAVSADHTIAATFEPNFDALDFAGTDGYVTFGNPAALKLSAFTIEMWMRRDGVGAGTNTGTGGIADLVPLLAKGRAEAEEPLKDINYIFGFRSSTGVLAADFEEAAAPSPNPSLNHPVLGTTPLAVGTWYHVAATYDGSTWRLYLNGALDAELAVGRAVATASDVPVSLGSALNSASLAAGFFDGRLDEVRVWNTARTAAQLASTIDARLNTPVPGLVARWGLDEGSGSAIQSTAGTPLEGALTGAGWTWSAGAPFDVPTVTVAASAGAGGGIDPSGAVPVIAGSTPSFTITPDTCHDIDDVLVDGASVGAVASYTFPPVSAGAHTIAASFALKSFPITATAGPNGSVTPAGVTPVGCGADRTYTFTPDLGYHVADVLVDGASVGAVGVYTFTGVAAAHTIAASFAQSGDALALSGTDGYVLFGNPSALKLNAFTIEMWMRRDGTGVGTNTGAGGIADLVPLFSKGRADVEDPLRDINYILGVSASTGVLGADFEEAAAPSPNPSLNHPVLGTTPLVVGTWYHVAATYDGATWRLYVNGTLDAQLAVGRGVASTSDAPVALGTAMTTAVPAAGFFQGACDEVRVWSVARTPAEILATINDRITAPATGLVARWGLDEGTGTLVQSTAGTALDGAVSGAGWSWTAGAPFNAAPPAPPAAPSNLTAEGVNEGRIDLTWTDGSNNESGFEIERSTAGSGGPFTPLISVAANTTFYSNTGLSPASEYCYRIRAVNGALASTYDGPICTTTASTPAFALAFNGSTYVSFGDPAALDLPQFTLETWFRRDGAGTTASTGAGGVTDAIPLVTHGTSQADGSNVDMNFFLGIKSAGAVLCADFEEGAGGASPGLNHPILGVTPIVNGVWYHAAATYDGATWKLYLNGNLESQLAVGQPVQSASIQLAALASSITSTGTAQGFFVGALDETRIWSAARTQTEIQGTINAQVASPATGLVARWALDEGSGTAVNGSAGTAVNGTITGTAYTWVAGAPFNFAFNLPPSAPALVTPADQATNVSLSPTLQVSATDPDGQALTVNFYGRSAIASPGTDFTIIGMPDTQYYTGELNGGTNAILLSQTNWITANRASRNIGYVATLGDCVEHGDNGGNDIEWQHADAGYSLIENPLTTGLPEGLPYGITVGNHDQSPNGNPDGATTVFYNQYFGMNRFTGRTYYGGHYGTNNDNWFNLFSAGGMDFVVISLEYDTTPDAAILAWADGLLTTYANRRAIILSHNFIGTGNPGAFSAQGQATYDALKGHSNVFLMLCGHVPGEGRRSDTFNGNTIYTVMSDYQGRTNGGNGWLRVMQFSPSNNMIHVTTYSPWLDQTENDADSQFDIPYSMSAAESYALLGTASGVASGGTASIVWPALLGGTPYQWYATVSDGVATVTGPTWGFTTQTVSTHALAVAAIPAAGGSVTRNPNRAAYDEGSTVQLTAAPASGWEFRSWCGDAWGTTSPTTLTMSGDKQVTAVFNEVGAPMVAVSAPNGGEALAIGSLYEIRWTATDVEGVELVDVLLSRNGPSGPFETLGEGIENSGSFLWAISYPGTANGYVKVVAHNPAGLVPSLSGFDLSDASFTIPDLVTGVDDQSVTAFSMRMTSSNPTSAGASVAFELPHPDRVRVELFDAAGRLVATLADAEYPTGRHAVAWKGRTSRGQAPSGVYFMRFRAPGHTITRRFVLVR